MYRRALFRNVVRDLYLNPVTPVSLNGRAGELVVDEKTRDLHSVWGAILLSNSPVIVARDACCGRKLVVVGVVGGTRAPWEALWERVVGQELGQRWRTGGAK